MRVRARQVRARPVTEREVLLGVDVGGTTTSVGVVTRAGEVLVAQRVPTHRDGMGRALETIVELIAAVRREGEGRSRAQGCD